jgi:hypothetical protein
MVLNEVDKLTKQKSDLLYHINTLKEQHRPYICRLEHPLLISVPPNNEYEINNGLLGTKRYILLKPTRNPHLTHGDLQNIIGMSNGIASYRNLYLFQNRNLPRSYNQPPPCMNVSYTKPWIKVFYFIMDNTKMENKYIFLGTSSDQIDN